MMKKWEIKNISNWSWEEHPLGGIIPKAGNASTYPTGGWRSQRPIRDEEKCNDCLLCFIFCPEAAIAATSEKIGEINLHHCKGCGICARECPREAIEMVDETEAQNNERGEKSNV